MMRGRGPRLFLDSNLAGASVVLEERDAHYAGHVLRLKTGDRLTVFDGRGTERAAIVELSSRRRSELSLHEHLAPLAEPGLELTLVQALVKSDAMDLIVQKATELGVRRIAAVKTDFSVVRLDDERAQRRLEHWRRIARSACEQCGRHFAPEIVAFESLESCLAALPEAPARIAFEPYAPALAARPAPASVCLLIGPEGGLSPTDAQRARAAAFEPAGLGPRTLRAETAAIAACAAVQLRWGDMR